MSDITRHIPQNGLRTCMPRIRTKQILFLRKCNAISEKMISIIASAAWNKILTTINIMATAFVYAYAAIVATQ